MNNMVSKKVERAQNENFTNQLIALYRTFRGIQPNQPVSFDFSLTTWVHPLLILPIGAHLQTAGGNITSSSAIGNYLSAIHFPNGVSTIDTLEQSKSYIPIGVLQRQAEVGRDRLESAFLQLLSKAIGDEPGSRNAIYYPISELTTNIFDHSHSDTGWILAQWYPNKKYLDLCIVDRGRGLAATYQEELGLTLNDNEAIRKALAGVSTKKEKERGYGVRTSKNVVCKALGGSFTLISGNAAYLVEQHEEKMVRLPDFNWPGVIISYRIPQPTGSIDIMPYLE
jgi:hypothetical protein